MSGPFDFLRDLLPSAPADLPATAGDLFAGSEPVATTPEEASANAQPPAPPEATAAVVADAAPGNPAASASGSLDGFTPAQLVAAFSSAYTALHERVSVLEALAKQNGWLS